MEEKWYYTENNGSGDNRQNTQRRSDSVSSSSRRIHRALEKLVSNSAVSLDLSRKDLQHLTAEMYRLFNLRYLHLEGNSLCVIPEDFFQSLSNLTWLDLRYNKLKELPSGIGCHKQLKTLLLERNPIKRLPVELGNVASLTALNLRHCPLEFPPLEVIQKGLPCILCFLRKNCHQNVEYAESISPEMPPVEKLNLADIMKSSLDLSDGWPNEEEMIRFKKLRDELIQDERQDYPEDKIATNDSLLTLRRTRTKESLSRKSSILSSRDKKNLFPAASSYDFIIQSKMAEECRLAALKEMRGKQALIEQRRKDKEVLQKWRKQSRKIREKKGIYTYSPQKGNTMVSQNAPYATDNIKSNDKLDSWREPSDLDEHIETAQNINSIKATDTFRAAKYKEVENRIKQHTQLMKEKRKKLRGLPKEDMEKANQDLETVEHLEGELTELKKDLHKEYRFTAFTGELLPTADNLLPTNIFSKMTF
ncbi:leucine-rich repeat-containing protein 27 isoform X1 [Thamnophis elegans]|uniref:leucine-rich repeat-containing protein 27 isoform X1 n=1 Tax=Thamnophis elegans TaxID=35005 RepID=UPI001377B0D0|nr:leucine-rich repeat-containing protein 27 isoform X1 [Thamnophis elegans]XP_032081360.1 leucine-rich repeat-containing protein 27 isoform X1 [Thamnophis elegans]XP_032081361.1 leucine-rich repeat-containing protein 27 isoform X1 [Thamnophis elegans]